MYIYIYIYIIYIYIISYLFHIYIYIYILYLIYIYISISYVYHIYIYISYVYITYIYIYIICISYIYIHTSYVYRLYRYIIYIICQPTEPLKNESHRGGKAIKLGSRKELTLLSKKMMIPVDASDLLVEIHLSHWSCPHGWSYWKPPGMASWEELGPSPTLKSTWRHRQNQSLGMGKNLNPRF